MSGSAPVNTEWYGHAAFKYLPIPETSQYMPERDEQLLGYDEAIRVAKGYTNMPIAPAPDYVNCAACETTWLVGYQGLESAANHPSHNTLFHHYSWQSRRSMVVRVHGACSDDGATPGKSSMGVFFGPKSSYNTSGILPTPSPTKQTAEILAAISAVRCVRSTVKSSNEKRYNSKSSSNDCNNFKSSYGESSSNFKASSNVESSSNVKCNKFERSILNPSNLKPSNLTPSNLTPSNLKPRNLRFSKLNLKDKHSQSTSKGLMP
ncbi:hypothetical protein MBLNU13_g06140t1 [Cladosporium sp. NU13]